MTHLTHPIPILEVMLRERVIERSYSEVLLVPLGSNVARKDLHL